MYSSQTLNHLYVFLGVDRPRALVVSWPAARFAMSLCGMKEFPSRPAACLWLHHLYSGVGCEEPS